jgi:alkanesulfonate monooxygenase
VLGSPDCATRVVQAGFEYLLIPVGSTCWEAWISGAFMAARSSKIKPLIAAMPGYINPVRLAKMISTFQRMSGGRICINLIAGQNKSEVEAEGVRYGLSGHLHDEEAERFGRLVRPILAELNRGRLAA